MQGGNLIYAIIILLVISWLMFLAVVVIAYRGRHQSRQELRRSRSRERLERDRVLTLVNNLTDAIISTDEHGIITMYISAALNLIDTNNKISGIYNAAALSLLDTNASIQGVHIDELLNFETNDKQPVPVFKELRKSPAIRTRDDIIMPLEGGDRVRLSATFAPVQGGNDTLTSDGYVLILRDITRVKSLEEERDEFISVISHELRTPITIAEASLSNVQLMMHRGMTDKLDDSLAEAHKSCS